MCWAEDQDEGGADKAAGGLQDGVGSAPRRQGWCIWVLLFLWVVKFLSVRKDLDSEPIFFLKDFIR